MQEWSEVDYGRGSGITFLATLGGTPMNDYGNNIGEWTKTIKVRFVWDRTSDYSLGSFDSFLCGYIKSAATVYIYSNLLTYLI